MTLTRSGNKLYEGGTQVTLRGICDLDVFYRLLEGPQNGNVGNELFWGTNCTDSYACTDNWFPYDALAPDPDRDFWWRYFWLVKNVLGLNCVRLGASNTWKTGFILNHPRTVEVMGAMLDMAEANGVYVVFMLSGAADYEYADNGWTWTLPTFCATGNYGLRHELPTPIDGSIWQPGSPAYNVFIQKAGDIMSQFHNHKGLGMWDVCEEPDFRYVCRDRWTPAGGRPAYAAWARAVSDALKAKDSTHLLTIGVKLDDYYPESIFYGAQCSWFSSECFNIANNHPNIDVASMLRYDDPEGIAYCDDGGCPAWFFQAMKAYADGLGKPLFVNEYAQNYFELYNPELRTYIDHYGIAAACAVRPSGNPPMPGYPVSPTTAIPAMPSSVSPCSTGAYVCVHGDDSCYDRGYICSEDDERGETVCPDGTRVVAERCVYNEWVATNETCETTTLPASDVVLNDMPSAVTVGQAVTVHGVLYGDYGGAYYPKWNSTLTIKVRQPNGTAQTSDVVTATGETDGGKFSFTINAVSAGDGTVEIIFAGDATHAALTETFGFAANAVPTNKPVRWSWLSAPTTVNVGQGADFAVKLELDTTGTGTWAPAVGYHIAITFHPPSGADVVATCITASDGIAAVRLTPNVAGGWTAVANWDHSTNEYAWTPSPVHYFDVNAAPSCPTPPYRSATLCSDGSYAGGEICVNGVWSTNPVASCPTVPDQWDLRVSGTNVYNTSGQLVHTGTDRISWALANANRVYVQAGTYTGLGEIYIPAGRTLFGDGNATVLNFNRGGLIVSDVSNVAVKRFRITGSASCQVWVNANTIGNILWEDLYIDHVTKSFINNAIGTYTQVNGIIQNLTYRRVNVDSPATWGFLINGDTTGDHQNVLYEDCVATYCGNSLGVTDPAAADAWIPGFDLCERSSVHGMVVRRCRADNNWESGFHFEESPVVRDVLFDNCTASGNGKKTSGVLYGAGCFAGNYHNTWPYCRFINFTGSNNKLGCVNTVESNVAVHKFACPFNK